MAGALSALSYSYSYSEVLNEYGVTNNAAANGIEWDMKDVLPVPGGLMINGVIYRYTIDKEIDDNLKVHIQNENALEPGYIFRETDDWSDLPGNTINKGIPLNNIPMEYFGKGSIELEGDGQISDPSVIYSYIFDTCFIPLTDPSCPGYLEALYAWLKENGLLPEDADPNDPFFDELVQAALNREQELEEDEEVKKEDEKEEDEEIEKLNAGASLDALADAAQQNSIMQSLSMIPNFENYYDVKIQGGVYEETVVLEDKELPDNPSALRNLAQDTLHRSMVRSQYEN